MKGINKYRYLIAGSFLALAVSFALYTRFHSLQREELPTPIVRGPSSVVEIKEDVEEKIEPQGPIEEAIKIDEGDTLMEILTRLKIPSQEAHAIIEAIKKVYDPRELKVGQEIYVTTQAKEVDESPVAPGSELAASTEPHKDEKNENTLLDLYIRPAIEYEVEVKRAEDGTYKGVKNKKSLEHETKFVSGTIEDSLYRELTKKQVPGKIIHEIIRAFSYDVDFQRDFHPGDTFEVIFDQFTDKEDSLVRAGEIQYAALNLGGEDYVIYRFQPPNGVPDFYKPNGESIRKALLRTPVDGARLSSTFGKRKHPILGYSKMHKGVDFAAPKGTPIMAAGDGVVQKAMFWNSYGNYVMIKHTGEFSTAYAHMSRFAKGMKPGKKVRQGEVIGFIGTTGRSTGPHLHYEVLKGGKHINPQSIKQLPGGKLGGKSLEKFKSFKKTLDAQMQALAPESQKDTESAN